MIQLIRNEWMKLWKKKTTWVLFIMLMLISIVPSIIHKVQEDKTENVEWRQSVEVELAEWKELYVQNKEEGMDVSYQQEQIELLEYRLANDIEVRTGETTLSVMQYGVLITQFISLFVVIACAGIVASEFSGGTIKMLLTRPISRAKILTSKLLTTYLYGFFLYATVLLATYLSGALLFEYGPDKNVIMDAGKIVETNVLTEMGKSFLLGLGEFFSTIALAFMIGCVFKTNSMSIAITFTISFVGATLVLLFSKYEFVKYIWITHVDLVQYQTGGTPLIEGTNMAFGVTILCIYTAAFLAISYTIFNKKDVRS